MQAIVVGAGPNGLAAAVVLARAGVRVRLFEASEEVGGGARTRRLTLPGFEHDVGAAVFPLGIASPVFRSLDLGREGLGWIDPPLPLAHPLDGGRAVPVSRSVAETARALGPDAEAYGRMMTPLATHFSALLEDVLAPLHVPRHPQVLVRFAMRAVRSTVGLARRLRTDGGRGLLAGLGAHSFLSLFERGSAAVGLLLGAAAHAVGWPFARGGARSVTGALAKRLRALGGDIVLGMRVESLSELPPADVVMLDLGVREAERVLALPARERYGSKLAAVALGPGVFKVDYALDTPVPWRAEACRRAGTVHVGGTLREIAYAEREVAEGRNPERPFVFVAQPSLWDETRAPAGKHTLWAYCHVPNGSHEDMTERIEAQIERFAPGFRDRIIGRATMTASALERMNPNFTGGDISGGRPELGQLLARPVGRVHPYATPVPGVYLCSAATPPGAGVHGMCGYHAARAALRYLRALPVGRRVPRLPSIPQPAMSTWSGSSLRS